MESRRGLGQRVELPLTLRVHLNEPGISKDAQVARHLGLQLAKHFAEVTDTNLFLCLQEVQNPKTSGVGEGAEEVGRVDIHKTEYD